MGDFIFHKEVGCKDLTKDYGINGADNIRIWRSSPTGAAIQLRSIGPTNGRKTGVDRHMIATMDYISRNDLILIRDAIDKIINELPAKY